MVVQSIADPAPAYRGKQSIVGAPGAYANKPPAAFISRPLLSTIRELIILCGFRLALISYVFSK
jgi:hypothetical protein